VNLLEKISGIYLIECLPAGRVYVGQSRDVQIRLRTHLQDLCCENGARKYNTKMREDWQTYGREAFFATVVERVDLDNLTEAENKWIARFRPEDLYNRHRRGSTRRPLTPAAKARRLTMRKEKLDAILHKVGWVSG